MKASYLPEAERDRRPRSSGATSGLLRRVLERRQGPGRSPSDRSRYVAVAGSIARISSRRRSPIPVTMRSRIRPSGGNSQSQENRRRIKHHGSGRFVDQAEAAAAASLPFRTGSTTRPVVLPGPALAQSRTAPDPSRPSCSDTDQSPTCPGTPSSAVPDQCLDRDECDMAAAVDEQLSNSEVEPGPLSCFALEIAIMYGTAPTKAPNMISSLPIMVASRFNKKSGTPTTRAPSAIHAICLPVGRGVAICKSPLR